MPIELPAPSRVSRGERRAIVAVLIVSALLTLGVGVLTPATTLDMFWQADVTG